LKESQLDLILQRIGYSSKSINMWDIERKNQLASYGGKVVDSELSDLVHEYTSTDGESYIINPKNKETVREIQINDLKKAGIEDEDITKYNLVEETETSNFMSMSSTDGKFQDEKFSALITVSLVGESANDYKYVMMLDYFWDSQPVANRGDNAGLYWGYYGQPVAGTAMGIHSVNYLNLGDWTNFNHSIDLTNNEGITSNIDYNSRVVGPQIGFLSEEVWVSKNYEGHNLALSGAYSHPWFSNDWSISVGIGSLSFSGKLAEGDKWSWRYNFMP